MPRTFAFDLGVSGAAIIAIGGLAAGWYALEAAVPTPAEPVTTAPQQIELLDRGTVEFVVPVGWNRQAVGQTGTARFTHPDGGGLTIFLTGGVTDFDVAAPRRLRELQASGLTAEFSGTVDGENFAGRTCTATGDELSGDCAVVSDGDVMVTLVSVAVDGGPRADLGPVIASMRVI